MSQDKESKKGKVISADFYGPRGPLESGRHIFSDRPQNKEIHAQRCNSGGKKNEGGGGKRSVT